MNASSRSNPLSQGKVWPEFWPRLRVMRTLPLSQVKDRLSELVESAQRTHDAVMITRNGSPVAVLVGIDEWDCMQETLYWLSQEGISASIAEGEQDVVSGRLVGEGELRAQFQPPQR